MKALRHILRFFFSLRTTIWLLLALLSLLFYGSIVMPLHEEFQGLQTISVFQWLSQNPSSLTWWLWGSIGLISILTANTIFCSFDSLIRKRSARQWLLVISPQVIHAGFLFILLAHLMSAYGSFKGTAVVYNGSVLDLQNGASAVFERISAGIGPQGYIESWSVAVRYYREGKELSHDVIGPNSPSFEGGLGIYVKNVQVEPYPAALIEVSREPGALWALLGGILFLLGMTTLLLLKARREEVPGKQP